MNYRREIDGLRALAVVPVILFHAGFQSFGGGFIGVDVFFVISGYLITSILIAEMETDRFSLVKFYERRARRILPALFFVIICCLPFAWFLMLPSELKAFSKSMIAVPVFSSNFLFWLESGYFDTTSNLKPLLHTWSLAVEEQYYLFFPLFLMLFWKSGQSKLLAILIGVLVASLGMAYWAVVNKPNAAFYLLPFRTWELLIGACAGFYLHSKANQQDAPSANIARQILSLLGIGLILYPIFALNEHSNVFRLYALVPTIGAALIILFATSNTFAGQILGAKPLVGIGLISYSAYLWHQPIFAFARHATTSGSPSQYTFLILIVLTLFLAWLSWRYIETPFRDKHQFNQKKIFTLSIIGSLVVIGVGLAGTVTQGFLSRYSVEDQYLAALNPNEAGKYVEKRFKNLTMKTFDPSSTKIKVLIIGDSYAEDLVNAMYESGLDQKYQFSTRHISHKCGNLFINFDDVKHHINAGDLASCEKTALFNDQALQKLITSADEVWFSSAWQYWQAELLPTSIQNLGRYHKKIRVFGVKSFGDINIKYLLSLKPEKRIDVVNQPSADSIKTNSFMRSHLPPSVFVDLAQLMCGVNEFKCQAFTPSGKLISYDGGHLTPDGAIFLGEKLKLRLQN